MKKFFLDLGSQPLANNYLHKFNNNQVRYNLKLYFDTKTKLVSISKRIPSKIMFNNRYPYRSSISKTMTHSFKKLSNDIKKKFNPKFLLEIGSNDGVLLKNFDKNKVIGVEPCRNLANITSKLGYKTYNKFWNLQTSKKIKKKYKQIDLVYSANTITHISNLKEVFKAITNVLSDEGILIIEDPSLLDCLKKNSYDQFYNEHIYVFSSIALRNILNKFNLEIFDIKRLDIHGGSLRYFIKRKKNKLLKIKQTVSEQIKKEIFFGLNKFRVYKKFGENSLKSKNRLIKIFSKIKDKNKTIIGYGATAKATTILNYCKIGANFIDYFVDTTPDKQNKYMPGSKIKILKYHNKLINKTDYIFLGAWNFKKEIFNKEKKFLNRGGKFITHIPIPKII